jgi:hypothetical protein
MTRTRLYHGGETPKGAPPIPLLFKPTHAAVNVNVEPVLADKQTACNILAGICPRALMQLVAEGRLNARKLGSRTVFEVDELRRFAASLPSWEPKDDVCQEY